MMLKINILWLTSIVLIINGLCYADSSVIITLINNSSYTFNFVESKQKIGNSFSVKPQTLAPTKTMIITGTITADVDLSGYLYFNDKADFFHVHDRRLKHDGQPIFSMHSARVRSRVLSKEFNKSGKPNELSYTKATVVLWDW